MDKRGQVFAFLLAAITIFLCGLVVWMYFTEQKNAANSLISPSTVLSTRDELENFEMNEQAAILSSLNGQEGKEINDEFLADFRKTFLNKIQSDGFNNFLLKNLSRKDVEDAANTNVVAYFNSLYSVKKIDANSFLLTRGKVTKKIYLEADEAKVNFPENFFFEFERQYLITYRDNKFSVREE